MTLDEMVARYTRARDRRTNPKGYDLSWEQRLMFDSFIKDMIYVQRTAGDAVSRYEPLRWGPPDAG